MYYLNPVKVNKILATKDSKHKGVQLVEWVAFNAKGQSYFSELQMKSLVAQGAEIVGATDHVRDGLHAQVGKYLVFDNLGQTKAGVETQSAPAKPVLMVAQTVATLPKATA